MRKVKVEITRRYCACYAVGGAPMTTNVSRSSGKRRQSAVSKAASNGLEKGAVPSPGGDFEARWARMDELAKQLDAVWPKDVSAVEAIQDVRR